MLNFIFKILKSNKYKNRLLFFDIKLKMKERVVNLICHLQVDL